VTIPAHRWTASKCAWLATNWKAIWLRSAGVAPPDGGSVFQPAFTYGGGLKLRITRLLEFQAEYRENYAKDPDFFNKQSLNLSS
jgi:hypothetical protein